MPQTTKVLECKRSDPVPGHTMYGEWAMPGRKFSTLLMEDLAGILVTTRRKPNIVRFKKIYAKPRDFSGRDDFSDERYELADPSFPGFLVEGMPNPENLPYRMVDGRRRLHKLKTQGRNSGMFYVFEFPEIEHLIRDIRIIDD